MNISLTGLNLNVVFLFYFFLLDIEKKNEIYFRENLDRLAW